MLTVLRKCFSVLGCLGNLNWNNCLRVSLCVGLLIRRWMRSPVYLLLDRLIVGSLVLVSVVSILRWVLGLLSVRLMKTRVVLVLVQ